jgi:hypothetical protein
MGGALGLLVPGLFVYALGKGIERAPLDERTRSATWRTLIAVVAAWTAAVWALSLAGVMSYHDGDVLPRVFVALFVPVVVGVAALASPSFRTVLDHTPLAAMVGVQSFRFAGAAFLLIVHLGILPAAFAGGGYGDLVTATLATAASLMLARGVTGGARTLFWAFSLAGLLDLANVAYLMLRFYPIWYRGAPTSAPTADFALIMIPAIAAPLALLLHTYSIRALVRG